MHVIARVRGLHVRIGVLWHDDEPEGTRFLVSPLPFSPDPVQLHELTPADRAELSAAALDAVSALGDAGRLQLGQEQVALDVTAPLLGLERTLDLLGRLVELQQLRAKATQGPYR